MYEDYHKKEKFPWWLGALGLVAVITVSFSPALLIYNERWMNEHVYNVREKSGVEKKVEEISTSQPTSSPSE